MIEHYYSPWPEPVVCPVCEKPGTLSYYDEPARRTIFVHEDVALQPCRMEGGSPYKRVSENTITFPVQMGAEFMSLDEAVRWGRRLVEGRKEEAVYLGYIRAHDGHRKVGALREPGRALAVVRRDGNHVVVSKGS